MLLYQFLHFIINVAEKGEIIFPPLEWPSFYLVSIYFSSYTQFLHSEERPNSSGSEIADMLKYSSKFLEHGAGKAALSLAMMVCAEDELLSFHSLETINSEINRRNVLDAMIASIDLARFRLGGWVRLTLGVLEEKPVRGKVSKQELMDQVTCSWMRENDLYEHCNLVVFNKQAHPYMLLASLFDKKPLGKAMPKINSCSTTQ
ncbi:unnamed protein product [Rhizoctonia solani]|uniref:Uncharacterized protein n=1 Tax=Rhizoctonia solani TaxID=456999 RepID=A0A8H3DY66_9AGAM|nr:unnamed protein product [Rhizoctonia solani]